jgi:hypothetical protein
MNDMLSRMQKYSSELKKPEVFNSYEDLKDLYPRLLGRESVIKIIASESIDPAKECIAAIMADLPKMIGFKQHVDALLPFIEYLTDCIAGRKKFGEDIITNWRL